MLLCPCKGTNGVNYRITQGFGERPNIYKQFGLDGHNGIDFAGPKPGKKIKIYAPYNGRVTKIGYDNNGFGNYIRFITDKDSNGIRREFTLAHFYSIDENIKRGAYLYLGNEIGVMGNTGFSSGVHLHLQMRNIKYGRILNYNNGYKGAVDFTKYLIKNWSL